jgi:hypothetical protein
MKNGLEIDDLGNKIWCKDGKLHREEGPAVEEKNGRKVWLINDKLHREDGPAIEYADGVLCWYLDDVFFMEV